MDKITLTCRSSKPFSSCKQAKMSICFWIKLPHNYR